MAGYITLYKWTQQGITNVKEAPNRIKQAKETAEKTGGRVVVVWVTLGQYDLVAVVDVPDDQTLAAGVLGQAMQGYASTQTMRAFSEEEFAQIVSKLP
jgi:uncharacterized protein with GYD domain